MRILHLCDSLNPAGLGGYESYLHYVSHAFASEGHKSVIVSQSPSRDAPKLVHTDHYDIVYLKGNLLEARKWEFLSLPEDQRESMVGSYFKTNDLEDNIKELSRELITLVDEIRPDVIHAHSIYVVFNRVLMAIKDEHLDGIPIVVSIHGLPKPLILPDGTRTTDYEQLVSYCPFDVILGVSETVVDSLRECLSTIGKEAIVRRLYNGVDTGVFTPRPEVEKKWDIGFLGRLEPMKAVDLFPEMLAVLKKRHPKLKMVITGEGSLKTRILREFEENDVRDLVDYLGVVDQTRVPEILNSIRVFLYPSRREPFGLSVIEAMACAVPVITANVYGPSEIVTNGHDGLTVTPGSVDELVDAIERLLLNPDLLSEIGRNARRTVESNFSL
ncbi:MAG: glycosyltransferase family 4 protein, partial [Candidatus Thorarchaeota archaeon]